MKKKIIYLLIAVVSTSLFSSCEKFLDREPVTDLSPSTYFKDKFDMRSWNAGMYDCFQRALGLQYFIYGEQRSDNFEVSLSYGDQRWYYNSVESSMSQYNWQYLYKTIYMANMAIEKFPKIPGVTTVDWAEKLSEAHGMRALMYFMAIRTWKDVPLDTIPWDGDIAAAQIPRTSDTIIKKLILRDIDRAIELLNTKNIVLTTTKYSVNEASLYALKMDVYMWYKEYAKAISVYNSSFGKSASPFKDKLTYKLVSNVTEWKQLFLDPTTSTESIFNMFWALDKDGAHALGRYIGADPSQPYNSMSRQFYDELYARHTSNKGKDARLWHYVDTIILMGNLTGSAKKVQPGSYTYTNSTNLVYDNEAFRYCSKFSSFVGTSKNVWLRESNTAQYKIPMYRLADVQLLYAEALNKTGAPGLALDIVNNIRKRVGYTADAKTEVADINNVYDVESIILKERQLELYYEGKRWFDLIRTDRIINVMGPVLNERRIRSGIPTETLNNGFGHEGRKWGPIFYREFEANPALKGFQNEPYTEG